MSNLVKIVRFHEIGRGRVKFRVRTHEVMGSSTPGR